MPTVSAPTKSRKAYSLSKAGHRKGASTTYFEEEAHQPQGARSSSRLGLPPLAGKAPLALWVGGCLTALLIVLALCAPWLTPYDPNAVNPETRLQPPNHRHWFGTDALGRDMLARVLYGARLALLSALIGTGTAAGLGIILGLAAGYYGGRIDHWLSRGIEIWMGFPPLLLAIIIVARLGPSLTHAVIALGIASAPSFFRITRSTIRAIRRSAYIEAARALGAGDLRIVVHHLLPNIAPPLIVLTTMRMGRMILAGGGLTFVGLGAQVPKPEWGALLAMGRDYLTTAPWLAIFPGLAVTLTVLGLTMLGEGLRDWLDIHQKSE